MMPLFAVNVKLCMIVCVPVLQLIGTKLSVLTDKVPYYPEFLLFAISEDGIAAHTNFSVIDSDIFGRK